MRSNLAIAGACATVTDATVLQYSPVLLWDVCYWAGDGTSSCSTRRAGTTRFCPCSTDQSHVGINAIASSSNTGQSFHSDGRLAIPNVTRWATVLECTLVAMASQARDFTMDAHAIQAVEGAVATVLPDIDASMVEVTAAAITGRRLQFNVDSTSQEVTLVFRVIVPVSGVSAGDVAIVLTAMTPADATSAIAASLRAADIHDYIVAVLSISEPIATTDLVPIRRGELRRDNLVPNSAAIGFVTSTPTPLRGIATVAGFAVEAGLGVSEANNGSPASLEVIFGAAAASACTLGCCITLVIAAWSRRSSASVSPKTLTIDASVKPKDKREVLAPHSVVPSAPSLDTLPKMVVGTPLTVHKLAPKPPLPSMPWAGAAEPPALHHHSDMLGRGAQKVAPAPRRKAPAAPPLATLPALPVSASKSPGLKVMAIVGDSASERVRPEADLTLSAADMCSTRGFNCKSVTRPLSREGVRPVSREGVLDAAG